MPPGRAFVVQFREPSEADSVGFAGRAEHMMSGHNASFVTPGELVDFFRRVINQQSTEHKTSSARRGLALAKPTD